MWCRMLVLGINGKISSPNYRTLVNKFSINVWLHWEMEVQDKREREVKMSEEGEDDLMSGCLKDKFKWTKAILSI